MCIRDRLYLHVAQCPLIKPHSPLDTLYGFPKYGDTDEGDGNDGDKNKGKKPKK
jgi:hypothetical protein